MSDTTAARFHPFRTGEGVACARRTVAPTDLAEQRRAVRWSRTYTNVMAVQDPLWIVLAVVPSIALFTPNWLVGLIVSAVCAIVIVVARRIAVAAWNRVRLADELIGIPVPDDELGTVLATRSAPAAMRDLKHAAYDDVHLADQLRPIWRKMDRFHDLYVSTLHRARQEWVNGDEKGWRMTTKHLPVVASMIEQYVELVSDR